MFWKLIGLLAFIGICNGIHKKPIYVYYESFGVDSRQFIVEQLYPTMVGERNLSKYLDIRLIPYGRSNYTEKGELNCANGWKECIINKFTVCAIEHIKADSNQNIPVNDREHILEYIKCLSEINHDLDVDISVALECAKKSSAELYWNDILDCTKNKEADQLQKKFGQLTADFQNKIIYEPTITFGWLFDENFQKAAKLNFREAVCNKLKPVPVECQEGEKTKETNSVQHITATILLTIFTFCLTHIL